MLIKVARIDILVLLLILAEIFSAFHRSVQSVAQSCLTLCDHMDCSTPGLPVHHQLPELAQTHVHQLVIPSNHLILCLPLFLPPSVFPSIRVFSSESVLHIRWPKDWSFSFSISPSNGHSGPGVGVQMAASRRALTSE